MGIRGRGSGDEAPGFGGEWGHGDGTALALPHIRALAPVGKGLLLQFPSRCCPSGTKGLPFSPGSGNRG